MMMLNAWIYLHDLFATWPKILYYIFIQIKCITKLCLVIDENKQ